MEWGFIWLMFVLKIPLIALLWLVWYAIKATPEPEPEQDEGGGNDRRQPRGPVQGGPPRRGPHAELPPASPARVRVARGRTVDPSHR
jgi:hypothetical protein